MSMDTRAVVNRLHDAYRTGDAEQVAALVHDDIDWCIYGPARIFPFEGPRRGKSEVLEVLAAIASQYQLLRYQPEIVIVEGDRAAAMVQTSFAQRSTGRTLSLRLVNLLRVENGQVIEFKEFSDTFDSVEQAMGSWLEVPSISV